MHRKIAASMIVCPQRVPNPGPERQPPGTALPRANLDIPQHHDELLLHE
jgi:hypothetical protein